jgi:hypothetical protein
MRQLRNIVFMGLVTGLLAAGSAQAQPIRETECWVKEPPRKARPARAKPAAARAPAKSRYGYRAVRIRIDPIREIETAQWRFACHLNPAPVYMTAIIFDGLPPVLGDIPAVPPPVPVKQGLTFLPDDNNFPVGGGIGGSDGGVGVGGKPPVSPPVGPPTNPEPPVINPNPPVMPEPPVIRPNPPNPPVNPPNNPEPPGGNPPTEPPTGPPTTPVPEPQTWALLIVGMGFVGAALRKRRTRIA